MRQFVRHPSDVPIEVHREDAIPREHERLNNVSVFGLSFRGDKPFDRDTIIKIRITAVKPAFVAKARVVWCRKTARHFDIGVEFLNNKDVFKARMVEQICHIEHYKKEVFEKEGRSLSGDEAALAWVKKYAARFPPVGERSRRSG